MSPARPIAAPTSTLHPAPKPSSPNAHRPVPTSLHSCAPTQERAPFFSAPYTLFSIRNSAYPSYFVSTTNSLRKTPGGGSKSVLLHPLLVTPTESYSFTRTNPKPNGILLFQDHPRGWGYANCYANCYASFSSEQFGNRYARQSRREMEVRYNNDASVTHPEADVIHDHIFHNDTLIPIEKARLSPGQGGLICGYGLFTTLRIARGEAFAYERHWRRLEKDAAIIHLPMPYTGAKVRVHLHEVIRANRLTEGCARIYLVYNQVGFWQSDEAFPQLDLIIYTAP